eukprot:CAMPEP_0194132484 /NCGR_PEP_ID=MMETSP0152-20130528/2944_1 /TAXON_ID=1049557 /ORGANISM="Thalassiothrix antarctica, Strain L6-D1" /LENGTH=307 /DNA_ID=CAMNT_0038827553 /DNA_START=141 /DNA_END=1061 /DNA_ORIENTATION=+
MTIEIIISLVSPQSVELQYSQCKQQEEQCFASPIIIQSPSGEHYPFYNNNHSLLLMHQQQKQQPSDGLKHHFPPSSSQLPFYEQPQLITRSKNTDEKMAASLEDDSVREQPEQRINENSISDTHHSLSLLCSSSPSSPSSSLCKKRVRFNMGSFIPHIHRNDMTEKEIRETWITTEEMKQIQLESDNTRRFIQLQHEDELEQQLRFHAAYNEKKRMGMKKKRTSKSRFCYRGLEGRQRRLITIARHAVLAEQKRQKKQQEFAADDDAFKQQGKLLKIGQDLYRRENSIATRYKSMNAGAITLAIERG